LREFTLIAGVILLGQKLLMFQAVWTVGIEVEEKLL
jgi:hypothetical protein